MPRREIQLLKLKSEHQADAEQRNDLHEAVTLTQILWRTENNSYWFISPVLRKSVLQLQAQPKAEKAQQQTSISETEQQSNERKDSMNQTHSSTNKGQSSLNANRRKDPKPSLYQGVDIALLEADNFLHNVRQEEVVIRVISIHEVNHLIENWLNLSLLSQDEAELNQMVKEKLPQQYWEFVEIFSKKVSDQLLLHKDKINHDIILKNENNLTLSSLYSMSLKQLKLVKAYLKDHLKKSFIVLSDASYASSVLFAKKSEERWHFCVNY